MPRLRLVLIVLATFPVAFKGWNIQTRIDFKVIPGSHHKSSVFDRHNRPVLQTRIMHHTNRVPHTEYGILDGTVGSRPGRQTCSTSVLVRVVAGRELLLRVIRSDPEVMPGKACAAKNAGIGSGQQERIPAGTRANLVADHV